MTCKIFILLVFVISLVVFSCSGSGGGDYDSRSADDDLDDDAVDDNDVEVISDTAEGTLVTD
jgi:hypothetical protein